jgi:hypothetical protein
MGSKKGGSKALGQAGSAIGKAINSNVATKVLNAGFHGLPGAAASLLQGKDPTKNTPIAGIGTAARGGNPAKNTPFDSKDPLGVKAAKESVSSPEGAKIIGAGIPAAALPAITSPVTQDQINTSQGGVTNSLASQQALINALAKQGNAANQSIAYGGMNNYTGLTTAAGASGIDKQQAAAAGLGNIGGQQQVTADNLGAIYRGEGPNPAMAALNQRTGENVANQAALMAGQRGAGANVGMMARQAAQQGGNLQQQAVGQGATMQAQQSLNALGQMGTQQSQMAATQSALGNLGTTQVGAGQTSLGAQAGQANTMATNEIGATNQGATANIANVGQQLGAAGNFNQAATAGQASVNAANSALAVQGLKNKGDIVGGALNGAGALGVAALAEGGEVDDFNMTAPQAQPLPGPVTAHPQAQSPTQEFLGGGSSAAYLTPDTPTPTSGMSSWGSFMKNLSYAPSSPDSALKQGASKAVQGLIGALGKAAMAQGGLATQGGGVNAGSPAQAATIQGNSYTNDKIPAVLSEGEVVIPRSIMLGKDPVRGAADFVAKILAKKGRK